MENYNESGYQNAGTVYMTQTLSKVMRGVYMRMCLALVVTALTAFFVASTPAVAAAIFGSKIAFWGIIIAEFAAVMWLSAGINKMSTATATLLFYAYSVLNGLVLSVIFFVYTPAVLVQTFLITAGVFGAMTVYGYFTNSDLSKMGSILFMALIGLVIASVVNIFLASSSLDWIISLVGVGVFVGLTAWDTQKIKTMMLMDGGVNTGKIATLGALSLYLDFVNLFLYLLRIFGGNRD